MMQFTFIFANFHLFLILEVSSSPLTCSFVGLVSLILVILKRDLPFFVVEFLRPVGVFSPFPISFVQLKKDEAVNSGEMWDIWAQNQLTSVGCGLLGKFMHLQVLSSIF